jgi:diaminopimelate epimerase
MDEMIPFKKYHGTGNDFIMVDQRSERFLGIEDVDKIAALCDRRFGIGADGLIILELEKDMDFRMIYFNADGRQSTMCGNGGRCIVKFAHDLGMIKSTCDFVAIDGPHAAMIDPNGYVHLKMADVSLPSQLSSSDFQLDTGSPHFVKIVDEIPLDIKTKGAEIRYSALFVDKGINVNFVMVKDEGLEVATYERGVEDETYSCGTGVVASAIVYGLENQGLDLNRHVSVKTKGGDLQVKYKIADDQIIDVWLIGPAQHVFDGLAAF